MNHRILPACILLAALLAGFAADARAAKPAPSVNPLEGLEVIDMTHPFDSQAIYWPTADTFTLRKDFDGITEGGYYYLGSHFSAAEHGGTHLDAPRHFAKSGQTAEQVPLSRLMGPAVVIDVSASALPDPDYRLKTTDIRAWEKRHGRIPRGAIVLMNSGYARFWPDRKRYMGTDERGPAAVPKLHFPGFSLAAAKLLAKRRVAAVGLDTPSIDYGQSKDFRVHRYLYARNIPGFENVAALDRLPPVGATVIALPMKIVGGSGAPLRIIALLPKD